MSLLWEKEKKASFPFALFRPELARSGVHRARLVAEMNEALGGDQRPGEPMPSPERAAAVQGGLAAAGPEFGPSVARTSWVFVFVF